MPHRPKPNWFMAWGPGPSFLLPSSSFLPLLVGLGEKGGKEEVERRKERGAAAPFPCPIWIGLGGARPPPLLLLSSSYMGPIRPIYLPGGSGNPPGTPVFSGNFRNLSGVRI